jgi:FtsH-binding integral membrane protein
MPNESILIGLAEVAIAFAGFSGVVAALSGKTNWSEADRFRFTNLLIVSIAAAIFSFLPIIVDLYGLGDAHSRLLVGSLLAIFSIGFLISRALRGMEINRKSSDLNTVVAVIFASSLVITAVLQIMGYFIPGVATATYVTGVLFLILSAATQFVYLILDSLAS